MGDDGSRIRVVTVRVGRESTYEEQAWAEIAKLLPSLSSLPIASTGVQLRFAPPDAGWLDFSISSGVQVADMELSDTLDPFRPGPPDVDSVEIGFIPWLERIVAGQNPTLAIECEGPWFIALVSEIDADHVRISASGDVRFSLDIAIDRLTFVRDFYRQLLEFWGSDALRDRWSEWGNPDEKQWSIRSERVEEAIG